MTTKPPLIRVFGNQDYYPGKTLDQPYAGAVLLAAMGYPAKTIETRPTRFLHAPHPVVICAGKRLDRAAKALLRRELVDSGKVPDAVFHLATGYQGFALALVTVVGSRPLVVEDFPKSLWWDAPENAKRPRQAWLLADMEALEPFAWTGRQGWSLLPRAMVDAAVAKLATALTSVSEAVGGQGGTRRGARASRVVL